MLYLLLARQNMSLRLVILVILLRPMISYFATTYVYFYCIVHTIFYQNWLYNILPKLAVQYSMTPANSVRQAVGTFFLGPLCFFPYILTTFLSSSFVSLFYFVFAVPMRECLGKHSCMSSPCNIAILNGTFLFSRGEIVCLGRNFVY